MKKIIMMTLSLLLLSFASMAQAAGAGSIEFMCKTKAKEVAAETYKGCITENKQAEVERIRKEYQSKLAELKAQYNSELKQLSPKKAGKASAAVDSSHLSEMPAKKMKSSKVKTEKIDFSTANKSSTSTEMSSNGESVDMSEAPAPETEIVEIPVQQE